MGTWEWTTQKKWPDGRTATEIETMMEYGLEDKNCAKVGHVLEHLHLD